MTDLTALALNAAHQLPVAELHGAVCGLVVCLGDSTPVADVVALLGVEAVTDETSVAAFVDGCVRQLEAEDLTFAPLLPADDVELEARLEALGQWCASFLAGLAGGLARRGVGSLDDCPEEIREIVRDFAAIARVDAETSGHGEHAAETDYAELEEFVKVGALLIMTTLNDEADDPAR